MKKKQAEATLNPAKAKETSKDAEAALSELEDIFSVKRTKNSTVGFGVKKMLQLYSCLALGRVKLNTPAHCGLPQGGDMWLMKPQAVGILFTWQ